MTWAEGWRARRGYFLLAGAWLVLDQATKVAAHATLPGAPPLVVVPGFFDLAYSPNTGGLFGYFRDLAQPWRLVLLTLIPLAAILMIVRFLARGTDLDRPSLFGLALILGGAIGNLIDRLARGYVVDFLDVYVSAPSLADWLVERFGTAHWPTFNVADSGIVIGACLLLSSVVFAPQPAPRAERPAEREPAAGRQD